MLAKLLRLLGLVVVGAVGVLWARMIAHSKLPPPEGRWREASDQSLF